MSKSEILTELPKLRPDEPLTDSEKALLDARIAAYEKNPDVGSSWQEVEERIRAEQQFKGPTSLGLM